MKEMQITTDWCGASGLKIKFSKLFNMPTFFKIVIIVTKLRKIICPYKMLVNNWIVNLQTKKPYLLGN